MELYLHSQISDRAAEEWGSPEPYRVQLANSPLKSSRGSLRIWGDSKQLDPSGFERLVANRLTGCEKRLVGTAPLRSRLGRLLQHRAALLSRARKQAVLAFFPQPARADGPECTPGGKCFPYGRGYRHNRLIQSLSVARFRSCWPFRQSIMEPTLNSSMVEPWSRCSNSAETGSRVPRKHHWPPSFPGVRSTALERVQSIFLVYR